MESASSSERPSAWERAKAEMNRDLASTGKMLRFGIIFAFLTAVFWGFWVVFVGQVPVISSIPTEKGYYYLPFGVSCWWSIAYIGLLAACVVFLFSKKEMRIDPKFLPHLIFSIPILAFLAGGGFGFVAGLIDKQLIVMGLVPGEKVGGIISTVFMILTILLFFIIKLVMDIDLDDFHLQEWFTACLALLFLGFGGLTGITSTGVLVGGIDSYGAVSFAFMGVMLMVLIPAIVLTALPLFFIFALGPVLALWVFFLKVLISSFRWANSD